MRLAPGHLRLQFDNLLIVCWERLAVSCQKELQLPPLGELQPCPTNLELLTSDKQEKMDGWMNSVLFYHELKLQTRCTTIDHFISVFFQSRNHPRRVFETVKVVNKAVRQRSRCHSPGLPGSSPVSTHSSCSSTPRTSYYGSDNTSFTPEDKPGCSHAQKEDSRCVLMHQY